MYMNHLVLKNDCIKSEMMYYYIISVLRRERKWL